jgi:hypothetical protein
MTVLIHVDTNKPVGDKDHLKVFANQDAAETSFEENDFEDVAFEYELPDWGAPARPSMTKMSCDPCEAREPQRTL